MHAAKKNFLIILRDIGKGFRQGLAEDTTEGSKKARY
jgi:hypothetical protein